MEKDSGEKDTKAILSRRQFLIDSTLAAAGAGLVAGGCREKPEVCLSVAPRRDPKFHTAETEKQPDQDGAPAPAPCLSPPAPEKCLTVAPKKKPPAPGTALK